MKNEQKQELRSTGVLALLGLIGFSMAFIATPWNRQMTDTRNQAALQKAEVVGYQVVQLYREAARAAMLAPSNKEGSQRLPASAAPLEEYIRTTGTMGQDPWGQPYHYRILSALPEGKIKILVWSKGPNQKVETAHLDDEGAKITGQPIYAGDDVGVLLSMNQN